MFQVDFPSIFHKFSFFFRNGVLQRVSYGISYDNYGLCLQVKGLLNQPHKSKPTNLKEQFAILGILLKTHLTDTLNLLHINPKNETFDWLDF